MSNRQKLLAKKEIHAQLNMEQRFVVAAAFNLSDWHSFWRVFCFVIRKRDTAAPSLTEVKWENDGF